jgi:hypothetical protein
MKEKRERKTSWHFDWRSKPYAAPELSAEDEARQLERLGFRECLEDTDWMSGFPEVRSELMAKLGMTI